MKAICKRFLHQGGELRRSGHIIEIWKERRQAEADQHIWFKL